VLGRDAQVREELHLDRGEHLPVLRELPDRGPHAIARRERAGALEHGGSTPHAGLPARPVQRAKLDGELAHQAARKLQLQLRAGAELVRFEDALLILVVEQDRERRCDAPVSGHGRPPGSARARRSRGARRKGRCGARGRAARAWRDDRRVLQRLEGVREQVLGRLVARELHVAHVHGRLRGDAATAAFMSAASAAHLVAQLADRLSIAARPS
jgi:hypothetical protein